ncbi:hypothetical protein CCACVL1_18270 [Corchorus capsularis]|uniref:Uncharacterized protein n=1 Tax=Corchorus capsularis TaxID=210143 RepID=A0A1R3HM18_COCAP|nr:hypothetical protein CCACVL1_18270 [Corchorus capsularis]
MGPFKAHGVDGFQAWFSTRLIGM